VVVLRGGGDRAFISGADIAAFGTEAGVDGGAISVGDLVEAITALRKPVVAALRGWCLGAGVMVALAADLRLAGEDLRLGIPAAKLGIAYPQDGVSTIVNIAGPAVAAELLITGDAVSATEAHRMGLVQRVVPADDCFDQAASLASAIAANAPMSVLAAKRAIAAATNPAGVATRALAAALISACYRSDDFAEGRRAFGEKRPPHFEGR
jgi:enoyl-CoA hydratase/carnithine racemase